MSLTTARLQGDWPRLRFKFVFSRAQRPIPAGADVVTAFRDGVVTLRRNRREDGFTFAEKEVGYQGVRPCDLVVHAMDGFAGAIGVSDAEGKCSPVCSVCLPRDASTDTRFFAYYLRYLAKSGFIQSLAKGIRERSTDFRFSELKEVVVPVPDSRTQRLIADFLDQKTATSDALIAKKQLEAQLLAEKRLAVITEAATRGLDAGVEFKETGYSWFGAIPKHWDVVELRRLIRRGTSITYGIVQAGPEVEDGIPYIKTSDMAGEELPLDGYAKTSPDIDAAYRRSKVVGGDIVVAIRATVGKALVVPPELSGANLTQGTARVSPGPRLTSAYLWFALRSSPCQQRFAALAKGATFREITLDMLRRFPIPVPPLCEQGSISMHLAREDARLLSASRQVEESCSALREYRQALVAAVVTGQLDVADTEPQEAA